MLERRVVLKDEADVAALGGDAGGVHLVDHHRPAVGLLQAADDAQQGGLATAAGAEQRGQLTALDVEGDVLERDEVAEALGDAAGLNAHGYFFSSAADG